MGTEKHYIFPMLFSECQIISHEHRGVQHEGLEAKWFTFLRLNIPQEYITAIVRSEMCRQNPYFKAVTLIPLLINYAR